MARKKSKFIPTESDLRQYDGAHTPHLWFSRPKDWRCPACGRSKIQIMRWTKRCVQGRRFEGWLAALHTHHCHSVAICDFTGKGRFDQIVICDQCNAADGLAKRKLGIPDPFSFSPTEIGQFVDAKPNASHVIDYERALEIYMAAGASR